MTLRRTAVLGLLLVMCGTAMAKGPHPAMSGIMAAADDAAVAGSNPAAMTRFDERVMRVEVYAFIPDNTWEGQLGNGTTFRLKEDDSTVIPSGKIVMPFRDNYWFGFTILGSGFSEDFGESWPGRYFVQDYDLLYISAFPSIATKINDQWSVAASLAITYTSYEQNKAVVNVDDAANDGKLNIDTDGFTTGFALSALYEASDRTRYGFSYRSELDPELDGNANFSDLTPATEAILDAAGLLGANVDVTSRSPQSILAGLYHEFDDTSSVSFDAVWADFSEFQLSEIYVNNNQVTQSDIEYDDIWAFSVGYNRPLTDRTRIGFGFMYVDDMVDDDERSMTLRLDSLWSAGVGIEWQWTDRRVVTVNLNYMQLDDAPVTSPSLGQLGTVTGEYSDRGTIWLNAALSFGTR